MFDRLDDLLRKFEEIMNELSEPEDRILLMGR